MQVESSVVEAIAAVRNDSAPQNWVIAGHQTLSPDSVSLVATGEGGFQEMVKSFDSSKVQYALLRVTTKVDFSDTVKFVYIYLLGEEVPMMKKGRLGVCKGEAQAKFQPYHVDFEISTASEITFQEVENKVKDAAGTLNKSHDASFSIGKQERGYTTLSKHVDGAASASGAAPAVGSMRSLNKSFSKLNEATPTAKPLGASKSSLVGSQNLLVFTDALMDAIKQVKDDSSNIAWVVGSYTDNDVNKPIDLVRTGTMEEGVAAAKACFKDNNIAYALVRVIDKIDGHDTVKFAFINWIGEKAGFMKKAKVGTHKGDIGEAFSQYHVDFTISEAREISDEIVLQKVQRYSGSKSFVK
ncbi:MAG: hypothetical protein SGCHY_005395 [Lobulomycetales sp.]